MTIKSPGRERPMETGAALCASVDRRRRTTRRSLRRRKLHILRSRPRPGAQSFRCSSSPNECDSHSLGTRSIFGDVHAAAENDFSPFRAHRARNSARLFRQAEAVPAGTAFLYSKLACGADARAYEGADAHGGEGGRAGDQRRLGAFRPVERGAAQRQKQRERQRRGERPR